MLFLVIPVIKFYLHNFAPFLKPCTVSEYEICSKRLCSTFYEIPFLFSINDFLFGSKYTAFLGHPSESTKIEMQSCFFNTAPRNEPNEVISLIGRWTLTVYPPAPRNSNPPCNSKQYLSREGPQLHLYESIFRVEWRDSPPRARCGSFAQTLSSSTSPMMNGSTNKFRSLGRQGRH